MYKSTLVLAAVVAIAAAQSTANIWLFSEAADWGDIAVSVISAGPTATAYAWTCAPFNDPFFGASIGCPFASDLTITEGPSTIHFSQVYAATESGGSSETYNMNCQITGSSSPVCTYTVPADSSSILGYETTVIDASETLLQRMDVSVIAGAGASAANIAASTTSLGSSSSLIKTQSSSPSSSTVSSSSTTSSGSSSVPTESVVKETGREMGPTSKTSTSTGFAPRITKAPWVLGCAALALVAL